MLLVNDEQTQILEGHTTTQQGVRANNDIHAAALQPFQHSTLLRRRAKARKNLDFDWIRARR